MNNKEKIQNAFNCFYNYNEDTQKIRNEFFENQEFYLKLLKTTLQAINEIEEKLCITVSEQYKDFLKAEIGNYIYNPDSTDEFRAYDAQELFSFNYIGDDVGYNAIEELKDFLIVGQDNGEYSYFFDIQNTLNHGTDTFWRVNRSSCSNFEIAGNSFIDFLTEVSARRKIKKIIPFEQKKADIPENIKEIFIEKLSSQLSKDKLQSINENISTIKNFFSIIRQKDDLFCLSEYWDEHIQSLMNIFYLMNESFPNAFVLVLVNIGDVSFSLPNISFELLLGEKLEAFNIGKKAKKYLKDMFVFSFNSNSLFLEINGSYFDYFFIDTLNKLGNGAEAIYIISENSKKLEEACYVAKDIVNLFRIFAEGEEINTTPIGKIK